MSRNKARCWIEAMRLRTLPVSLSGVIYAVGLGMTSWHFRPIAAALCLLFALLAQIASNFANEYYDFKAGFDKSGRIGPRRGVTEGDISPRAMKTATFATLAAACAVGCFLVWSYGQWWMYAVGIITALGVIAYSTGPFPLSRHCLGELAVICFFGIIPVCLTYILMGGTYGWWLLAASFGIGLMGANVLIVNNYRDMDDDKAVSKHTLTVAIGRRATAAIYLANGILALILTLPAWIASSRYWWIIPLTYTICHTTLYFRLSRLTGTALNPLLGITAILMLFYTTGFIITILLS